MINNRTKYAIKALMALALSSKENPMPLNQIALERSIPLKFLEAIMRDLTRQGWVFSTRGREGGYRLRVEASKISVGDVIRFFNGPLALLPCASVTRHQLCDDCPNPDACSLRLLMQKAREATASVLDKATVAALTHNEKTFNSIIK